MMLPLVGRFVYGMPGAGIDPNFGSFITSEPLA